MLLLVTILLVLVAAVTLLIGIFSDNLALIFISIGASALAAIVLAVLSQMSRRKAKAAEAGGAEPLPTRQEADAKGVTAQAAVGAATEEPPTQALPAQAAAGAPALPIDGYDALRVNEILPRLVGLDLDQLEEVAQHEEAGKNRTTVLNRIDQLMDELEAADVGSATPAVADDVVEEAVAAIEEMGEPVVAMAESAPESSSDGGFPIAGYDDLSEADLIAMFDDLDADQLETVADREEAGQNRDAVLDAIDDRLDILEGIVAAPAKATRAPKSPAKRAPARPAKKTAATRTPAKKATATASPARKVAAPARKTAKAPARKAAATSVRKTAAAPTRKAAAAAKAPAKRATSPAKRATSSAKKVATTARKAAPVKKATAAKKAAKR